MSRPALSAYRGSRIIDFLSAFPDRRFSLTAIARATEVNRASCHAILQELEQRGYLCRHATSKTYWLGPVLVAAGHSAVIANPILARARAAGERLREDLGLPVLLSTTVGDEIMCVFSLSDAAGRIAGLRAGDRVPLVPPVGMSFLAWAPPDEADAWIARRVEAGAKDVARRLHDTLALTRERGFHVTLRIPEKDDIASVLARVTSGDRTPDFHRTVLAFVTTLDVEAAQPNTSDDAATYDVQLIAAPIVDPETLAVYNLCLGGFSSPLAGTAIAALGGQLTTACLEVMKAEPGADVRVSSGKVADGRFW